MVPSRTILITGDSLVEGVGDSQGGWALRIAQEFAESGRFVIRGFGGQNVLNLSGRIAAELAEHQPSVVMIQIGVNDSRIRDDLGGQNEVEPFRFAEAFKSLLEITISFPTVDRVMVIGPPRVDERQTNPYKPNKRYLNQQIETYEAMIEGECQTQGVEFVPIRDRFAQKERKHLLSDGIHPSDAGHQAIAMEVLPILQGVLKEKTMSRAATVDFYKIAVEMHNVESKAFWVRNSVFLFLVGALLAGMRAAYTDPIWKATLCSVGLLGSFLWYGILVRGKDQIARWSRVVHKLEAEYQPEQLLRVFHLADQFAHSQTLAPPLRFLNRSASRLMKAAAVFSIVAWAASLVFCIWLAIRKP